ncbi:PHP domain-containing protein [Undibacterium pigrum]|uniref:PHP domain-containing protein n=1 Tax=Undibacterium pigrum TaxID=401470 RepID=UPI00319DEA85
MITGRPCAACRQARLPSPGLTDECSVAGVVRAHVEAKKHGLHLIIGSQMIVTPENHSPPFNLIVLAKNKNGYGNLSVILSSEKMDIRISYTTIRTSIEKFCLSNL